MRSVSRGLRRGAAISATVGILALGGATIASAAPQSTEQARTPAATASFEMTYGGYRTVDDCLYWQPIELAYQQGGHWDTYLSQACYEGRDGLYYFTIAW